MLKLVTISVALIFSFSFSQAQLLNKLLPASPFADSLSIVLESYQQNYRGIQGIALQPDEDRQIFASTVGLPGASSCVIFRFNSRQDTTAGWQATLYEGEDFREASKAYKNAIKSIKQSKLTVGISKIAFHGEVVNPSEDLRFTSSIFKPAEYTEPYKNFMAEVEMLNSMEGWVVRLNLHSRKDDTERYQ